MFSPDRLRTILRQGTQAVVATQVVSQAVMLGILAVLYHKVGPGPYGLLGMAMTLQLLLRIVSPGGLDVAAVQQAELNDRQMSGVFWMTQLLGLLGTLAMLALTPAVVWFYADRPGATTELRGVALALSGTLLAAALATPHQALLQRHMRLGRLAVIRVTAQISGGLTALVAALAGGGVWALVGQQYVELLVLAGLAWWSEPWRPLWTLDRPGTRGLIRFGGFYTLSGLMFYAMTNIDKILVGRLLGEVALGLYGQAFNLAMKPVNLVMTPLTGIMLPALSRATDRRQFHELVLGFNRAIALIMLPAGMGLVIVAPEAIRVMGGPRWAAAGPLLAALGIAVLVQGFFNALGSVFASSGHPLRLFGAAAIIAVVMSAGFVAGLAVGWWAGRPELGVALGYSLTLAVVVFPPYAVYALRMVGLSWRQWLVQIVPAARAALLMGLIVLACRAWLVRRTGLSDPALLAVELVVGVAVYASLARGQWQWLWELNRPR